MAARPVPVSLIGPNVAQVRPMVHAPVPAEARGLPQTILVPSPRQWGPMNPEKQGGLLNSCLPSATVPPGRYKYTTANINGQQGVYLVPLSKDGKNLVNKVFVPFSSTNPPPITNLLLRPGTPINQMPGQAGLVSGTPQSSLVLPVANLSQSQTAVPTGSFMNTAILQQSGVAVRSNVVTPSTTAVRNLASGENLAPGGNTTQQIPVPMLVNSAAGNKTGLHPMKITGTPIPSTHASSVLFNMAQETRGLPNELQSLTAPGVVIGVQNPEAELGAGVQTTVPSAVSAAEHQLPGKTATPKTFSFVVKKTKAPVVPALPVGSAERPGVITVFPGKDGPRKTQGTVFIPQSVKLEAKETQQPDKAEQPITQPISQPRPPTNATEHTQTITVKQEVDNGEYDEAEQGFQFKIDSVFSLSSSGITDSEDVQPEPVSNLPDTETTKEEPVSVPKCEYDDTRFVVLQNLNLQSLTSVDVRKFRKLTGRQSCTRKCRLRAINRLCRLQKLCVKGKDISNTDKTVSQKMTDIKMDPEELQEFEFFASRCKPAPRVRKLKLFRESGKTAKAKLERANTTQHTPSPAKLKAKKTSLIKPVAESYLMSNGKPVAQEVDPTMARDHVYANKAVSLLNPGSKPVQGWVPVATSGGSPKSSMSPASVAGASASITTKSPAFLKAASSLGTKKFYLIKVEGKNILIPVEQSGIQPRAYILGNDKSASEIAGGNLQTLDPSDSPASVQIPLSMSGQTKPRTLSTNTKVHSSASDPSNLKVKPKPLESGHNSTPREESSEGSSMSAPQVRVKSEPMRGYADEEAVGDGPPRLSPPCVQQGKERGPTVSDQSSSGACSETLQKPGPLPKRPAISSSADRIRKLKEMLKKNEEELEQIKRRRKEEAVDIDTILDKEDL